VGTWLSFVTGSFAGPVCLAITVVGLVLSGLAWRRRGAKAGIRGAAWSVLPAAAWLTNSLAMLGRMVSALVSFASSFVFSPKAYVGIILVGVSAVLFLGSGGIPLLRWRRRRRNEVHGRSARGGADTQVAAHKDRPAVEAPQEDDLADVREILRRRGIR
jgi:hypothetical protein